MPLQKQTISINFAQGLDQKTDPKLTAKLTTADNVVMRKNGTIEKRTGFARSGLWFVFPDDSDAAPLRVFPFREGEFVVTDWSTDVLDEASGAAGSLSNIPHTVQRIGNSWQIARSNIEQIYNVCTIRTRAIYADSGSVTHVDMAIANRSATSDGNGVYSYCGPSSANTSIYNVDMATEVHGLYQTAVNFVTPARFAAVSSQSALVASLGCLSTTATTTLTMLIMSATAAIGSYDFNGIDTVNRQFDMIGLNTKIYFAAKMAGSVSILLGSVDLVGGTSSTTAIPGSITAAMLTIATPAPGTDRIRLFWTNNNASNTALYASYSLTLSQIVSATTVTIGVPGYGNGLLTQIGACENAGFTTVSVFFTQSSTTGLPTYTAWNADYSNTQATVAVPASMPAGSFAGYKSASLAAKPFLVHNKPHIFMTHTATAQQSYVVAKQWGGWLTPAGRCLFGLAAPNPSASYNLLPQVQAADDETFYLSARRAVFFKASNGNLTVNYGAEMIRLNFSQTQPTPYVQAAGSTYLGGGFVSHYDAMGIIESGFLSSPVVSSVSTTTTGGSLGAASGAYSVVILKEFTDHTGRTHRGTPSLPVSFTTSTTTSQATVIFNDGPNLKSWGVRRGQIRYSVFRTTNGGTLYYRDVSTSFTAGANTSLTPMTLSMTVSDSTLSGNDVIYTNGGSLPNWTPDSCEVLFMHGNRLFCEDPTDVSILRYSKEIVEGEGVAFAQSNIVRIPGVVRITAGASMDSNCIVFRARSIHAFGGDGPDDTGQNGSFSDGQILFQDIGCVNQRNLCRFRDGVVFKSPDKGFHLLTRDLQLKFIGADVESYNSKTVVSSEAVAMTDGSGTVEECRFLCSDGTLLTYNYYNGQWTTATLTGCTDAIQSAGRYMVVSPTSTTEESRVFQQSTTVYVDEFSNTSKTYQMTVETGWYKVADVQGLQRVWRGSLLGEAQAAGRISVEIGYDYESAYNETHTATMSSVTAANYTGGATAAAQFEFGITRQKCQAIRFRIKDYPTTQSPASVMKLTNISLECGVKGGLFRLPSSKGV